MADADGPRRGRAVPANVGDPDVQPVGAGGEATGAELEAEQVETRRGGEELALEERAVLVGAGRVDLPEGTRRWRGQAEVGGDLPGGVAAAVEQPPLDEGRDLRKAGVRAEQRLGRRVGCGDNELVAGSHVSVDERP